MKMILEGSHAIALTIKLCGPDVVSAYPITPQTHIVEDLAKLKADGEAKYEYVRAESEFAAASIVMGASQAGVRTYTATASQGLLLMAEVLFNIAGQRLPVVLTCANRAVSAPINIWNDQQDSVTVRDSGWIMLYAETNQEAIDMHICAYKIAEQCSLPVMVNMDGFVLTHTFEPIDLPGRAEVNKFLPKYSPKAGTYLDVKNPRSFGCFATPADYMEIRQELHEDMVKSKALIKKSFGEFKKTFGRGNVSLIEEYRTKDADTILIAMGSVCGTIKDSVDLMRKKGQKAGLVKIKCLRPFPSLELDKALGKAKYVGVLDKSISLGNEGILAADVKASCSNGKRKIQSFIVGLGGKDITETTVAKCAAELKKPGCECKFVY